MLIKSGVDHSLQPGHSFIPCVLFVASITSVCLRVHFNILLIYFKGLSGRLLEEALPASWRDSPELKQIIH